MARDPPGERELAEEPAQPLFVRADVRIELAVRAFEPSVRDDGRAAVARAGHVDDVEIALPDRAVQVHVDEIQPRDRSEVPEQPRLDVLRTKLVAKQGIVE